MGMGRQFRLLFAGESGERLLVVSGIIVTTQMAWTILVPVLPAFAGSLHIGHIQIGFIVAAFGVGRVLSNIPAGYLGQVMDRTRLLILSSLAVVLFSAACGLAGDFTSLLILRALMGAAGGVAITTGQSLLADAADPLARGRTMSFLQAMNLTGTSIGPAVGGAASLLGLRAPFFVSGAFCLAMVLWLLFRPRLRRSLQTIRFDTRPASVEVRSRLGQSFFASCVAGFAVFFARFGVQQTLIPLVAYEVVGLTVAGLSFVLSGMAALNFICAVALGGISDSVGRKPVIVFSLVGAAVATSLLGVATDPWWFIAVCALFGLTTSIGGPVPAAYVADIVTGAQRSTAIGVYRTFGDIAGIIGPIGASGLLTPFGAASAALLAAGVSAAAAGWFSIFAREARPGASPRDSRAE